MSFTEVKLPMNFGVLASERYVECSHCFVLDKWESSMLYRSDPCMGQLPPPKEAGA